MKRAISMCLLLLSIGVGQLSAQSEPKAQLPQLPVSAKEINEFVPAGWRIQRRADGDLNGDGLADTALILRGADKTLMKKVDSPFSGSDLELVDPETGKTEYYQDKNPFSAVVLLGTPGGYSLSAKNAQIFSVSQHYSTYPEAEIKDRVLKISVVRRGSRDLSHPWELDARFDFEFQMLDERLVLVRAESPSDVSYDFLKYKGYVTGYSVGWENLKRTPRRDYAERVIDLVPFEKVSDDIRSLDSEPEIKSATATDQMPLFDGLRNFVYSNPNDEGGDRAAAEKDVREKDAILKSYSESEEFRCRPNTFRMIDSANGRFIKTDAKAVKKKVTTGIIDYTVTIEPQNAFLYQLCSAEDERSGLSAGGVIITENGKVRAHYIFKDIPGFYRIDSFSDLNKNGLSEIGLEFSHSEDSQNFTRSLGLFEVSNSSTLVGWGEIDFFRRGADGDTARKISVKRGKKPRFYHEEYTSPAKQYDWKLKGKTRRFEAKESRFMFEFIDLKQLLGLMRAV